MTLKLISPKGRSEMFSRIWMKMAMEKLILMNSSMPCHRLTSWSTWQKKVRAQTKMIELCVCVCVCVCVCICVYVCVCMHVRLRENTVCIVYILTSEPNYVHLHPYLYFQIPAQPRMHRRKPTLVDRDCSLQPSPDLPSRTPWGRLSITIPQRWDRPHMLSGESLVINMLWVDETGPTCYQVSL